MNYITQVKMENAEYPALKVYWEQDEDGHGWEGKCVIWKNRNEKGCDNHSISLRQTMPLGLISVSLDICEGGSWASSHFEGHGITERDLFWAASWAILAIKDHHRRSSKCKNK